MGWKWVIMDPDLMGQNTKMKAQISLYTMHPNPQNSKYTHKTQNTPKVIVYLVNGQTQLILPNQAQTYTKTPIKLLISIN